MFALSKNHFVSVSDGEVVFMRTVRNEKDEVLENTQITLSRPAWEMLKSVEYRIDSSLEGTEKMNEPVLLEKPGIYTVVSDYRDTGGLLHIREWVRKKYGLGGLYPTKIGICLNKFGWNNLKECMCAIDDKLAKQLKRKSGKTVTATAHASLGNLLGNNAVTTDSDSSPVNLSVHQDKEEDDSECDELHQNQIGMLKCAKCNPVAHQDYSDW